MYSYLVFRGNSSNLVEDALLRRPWWKGVVNVPILDSATSDMKKILLHRKDESIKEAFEKQLFNFCWKSFTQVKYCISAKTGQVHTTTLHSIDPVPEYGRSDNNPHKRQLVNHFANIEPLCTKNGLLTSLKSYYPPLKLGCFDATPTTFVCTSNTKDKSWQAFVEHFKDIARKKMKLISIPWKHCSENMWILKPTNSNQGRGIEVFKELTKIKSFMRGKPKGEEWIFQKYLERPLLLWGRKFDIRVWVTVTENFEIYIHNEGYLRTSSESYTTDLDNTKNGGTTKSMVHLTNFCMQKHGPNVGKYEDGNTLSFKEFQQYLDDFHADDQVNFRHEIFPRVKQLCVDAILSAHLELEEGNKGRHSAELFGFDFMVDEDYRTWLIEVNTNPFLGTQNEWHGKLVSDMIEGFTQLTIDRLFPKPKEYKSNSDINTDLIHNWKLLYNKESNFLEVSLLPNSKREQLGVGAWYFPRSVPEMVQRQNNGERFEATEQNMNSESSRKFLNSGDRAASEARKRVRKRAMKLKEKEKKQDALIEDMITATKRLRAKQRQKERRERRIAFVKRCRDEPSLSKDAKEQKKNTQSKDSMQRVASPESPTTISAIEIVTASDTSISKLSLVKTTQVNLSDDKKSCKTSGRSLKSQMTATKRPSTMPALTSHVTKNKIKYRDENTTNKKYGNRTNNAITSKKIKRGPAVVTNKLKLLDISPRELAKESIKKINDILFPTANQLINNNMDEVLLEDNNKRGHPFINALYENGLNESNQKQYGDLLDAINHLQGCPTSNSVLICMAQRGVIELLWPICGIERTEPFSKAMQSTLGNSYISLIQQAEDVLIKIADLYRVQLHIRRQAKMPQLIQIVYRSVTPLIICESNDRNEVQLFALRVVLHNCKNVKSICQKCLLDSYVFHAAVYLNAYRAHPSACHIAKEILECATDQSLSQIKQFLNVADSKTDGIESNNHHCCNNESTNPDSLYAKETLHSLFSNEEIMRNSLTFILTFMENRKLQRAKQLEKKEKLKEKKLKEEEQKRLEKKKYNKWVQERAQFALEKRGKMSQLQQQKAMREEQNRRENKRLKEMADQQRRARAERLKNNWKKREEAKRMEKLRKEAEIKEAQIQLTELAIQRREENKRNLNMWLDRKKRQDEINRIKLNQQIERSNMARQVIIHQRQQRLTMLLLNKAVQKNNSLLTSNRSNKKDVTSNKRRKRVKIRHRNKFATVTAANKNNNSGSIILALPPLGRTHAG